MAKLQGNNALLDYWRCYGYLGSCYTSSWIIMNLKDLNNKKILILGLEEEGIDNLFFIKKKIKYKSLGVADISPLKKK